MNDTLHQEPERDRFKTESPIRAFTSWTVQGRYALGKGFRPSLAHVIPYLDAMEAKEGWQIVQVLEADTQTPSFLFRQSYVVPDDVLVERLRGDDGFKQQVRDWLNGEEPYDDPKLPGFEEAAEKMDRARNVSDAMTVERTEIGGHLAFKMTLDTEKVHHTNARWTANIDMLKKAMFGMKRDALKKFLDKEMVLDRAMYWETASVASVLRLIDKLEYWDHISLTDFITEQELGKVLGRKFRRDDPALIAAKTDIYASMAETIFKDYPACKPFGEAFTPAAERFSDDVDPASRDPRSVTATLDDINPEHLAAFTGQPLPPIEAIGEDDPINPKHYGGAACAEIGELLSANSYQVLKYNWRLGEKDSPCVEIGKALWYLDRELALIAEGHTFIPGDDRLPDHTFFDLRLQGRSEHTTKVARSLISWNRYGNPETLKLLRRVLDSTLDSYNGCNDWGNGLAI